MNRISLSGLVLVCSFPFALAAQTEGVNMNMSIDAEDGQMNMNISIDAEGDGMNMDIQMDGMNMQQDMGNPGWDEPTAPGHSAPPPPPTSPAPMDDMDFERYLNAVKSKDFEDSKLSTAKAPLRGQYLTADQVAQVMRAFDFEDTRLEFATFAHPRCVDPSNYYLTYGAFDFELTIEELEEAIGE